MVYGGPHAQTVTNSWAMTADFTAQFLAELGFAVWKADNRGSARRGHVFEQPLHRNMGTVEVRDQVDGVKFVAASWPEVDTNRVGVTGRSYGGYMTLRCLMEAPHVFKAGVSVARPSPTWDGYDDLATPSRLHGHAERQQREGLQGSPPVLYPRRPRSEEGGSDRDHGLLDENVHFRHSARLANALIAANRPFEILPLPDSRHSPRREADRKYVAEQMARFFTARLAAP